jgi:hypothetical protein
MHPNIVEAQTCISSRIMISWIGSIIIIQLLKVADWSYKGKKKPTEIIKKGNIIINEFIFISCTRSLKGTIRSLIQNNVIKMMFLL